jgi:hypothetical protein
MPLMTMGLVILTYFERTKINEMLKEEEVVMVSGYPVVGVDNMIT